jgi:hypothetical protein
MLEYKNMDHESSRLAPSTLRTTNDIQTQDNRNQNGPAVDTIVVQFENFAECLLLELETHHGLRSRLSTSRKGHIQTL